jgi:hypothetical protein
MAEKWSQLLTDKLSNKMESVQDYSKAYQWVFASGGFC